MRNKSRARGGEEARSGSHEARERIVTAFDEECDNGSLFDRFPLFGHSKTDSFAISATVINVDDPDE